MKIYIAARYGRKAEAKQLAEKLIAVGHEITSTWLDQKEDEMLYNEGPKSAGVFARKDLNEIDDGDVLIYLAEVEGNLWGRGGRHVEFGYALGTGKLVIVLGPMENIFHYLPEVVHFNTEEELLERVKSTDGSYFGRG